MARCAVESDGGVGCRADQFASRVTIALKEDGSEGVTYRMSDYYAGINGDNR